ncbi:MAG: hypothetical protein HPY58_01600 [Firmicutes bacterium]|nr:hypothetical protein [Bacillota bacterium]
MCDDLHLAERTLSALLVGIAALAGGLFIMDPKGIKALGVNERAAAALLIASFIAMLLAGASAGWLAGRYSRETMLPLGLAWAGAYLVPMVAWFAGLEVAWPVSLAYACALAFAGSWAGLSLSLVLCRGLKR